MYALSAAQMQGLDAFAIASGLPAMVLMERAALAMEAALAVVLTPDSVPQFAPQRRLAIFCGAGNNGGDGLALARLLNAPRWQQAGFRVEVYLQASFARCSSENQQQQQILKAMGVKLTVLTEEATLSIPALGPQDIAIDALLGVGLNRDVKGPLAALLKQLNQWPCWRVALDLPTGLDTQTGAVLAQAFRADLTLSCAQFKYAHVMDNALPYVGRVQQVDIGIPQVLVETYQQKQNTPFVKLLRSDTCAELLGHHWPQREPSAHKGAQGKVAVFAGSPGMMGACLLSLQAALESGPGYLFAYTHSDIATQVASALPEVQVNPFPEIEDLETLLKTLDAVLIGPGLGRSDESLSFCEALFEAACATRTPLVIDADGLFALEIWMKNDPAHRLPTGSVVTPHPGEAAHLLHQKTVTVQADRLQALKSLQQALGVTVVLKGAKTLVATSATDIYVSDVGNAGLARGGAGDVLAGLIVGLHPQTQNAATLGVYWHGTTADHVARHYTQQGVRIQRLLDHLAEVWALLCARCACNSLKQR